MHACRDFVRRADYANYLWTIFLPNESRRIPWCLLALNAELGKLKVSKSNDQIKLAKLYFWKDAVNNIIENPHANDAGNHFILKELSEILQKNDIQKYYLQRLIKARENDIVKNSCWSVEEIENSGENTLGSIFYIVNESLKIKNLEYDHAMSHIAKASAISRSLQYFWPALEREEQVLLPLEILSKHEITQQNLGLRKNSKEMKDAVFEIAKIADNHLKASSRLIQGKRVSGSTALAFMPTRNFLRHLERYDFDLIKVGAYRDWKLIFSLMYANMTNKLKM